MIFAFSVGMGIFIFLRVASFVLAGLKASKVLHNRLIARVFNAPINLFFDVTPIGKILNRFSKDLAIIDEQLFFDFGSFLSQAYQALAALIVAAIVVPYIIILIGLFLIFGYWLFSYSIRAYKDCYRISQVAMSPVLSFFQETFSGNSIIRAFHKDSEFKDQAFKMINKQAVSQVVTMGVWGWYSMRLIFLSIILLVAGCVTCCLLRNQIDPVLLSMMLQYLLTLQGFCLYMLYFYGEIERKMVSVQRLLDLEDIVQEVSN